MEPVIKKVRARVRGRQLELLEDVDLPPDREVTVGIEMPPTDDVAEVVAALRASAGAWSDDAHPELSPAKTRSASFAACGQDSTPGYDRRLRIDSDVLIWHRPRPPSSAAGPLTRVNGSTEGHRA